MEESMLDHCALSDRGWKAAQEGALDQAISDLRGAVAAFPQSAVHHYRLGCAYWDADMKKDSVNAFVESARLKPDQPDVFRRLGSYYEQHENDPRRATRCYQKAVALDPENNVAGELLSKLLDREGQYALEKSVCLEAVQKSPRAFWAWRCLGYLQAAQKEWSQAAASLQFALRHFTEDAQLWEALGLCYHKLSMFTAAVKAYGRAFEIDSSSVFCAIELGNLHLSLSAYSKATDCFRQALLLSPSDLSAAYGLATSLLQQSRECFKLGALTWGSTLLEEAIQLAERNTITHSHLASLWKQLGDSELLYAQMAPFDEDKPFDAWKSQRIGSAQSAVHAFRRALHLIPEDGTCYRDLSIALALLSQLEQQKEEGISQCSQAEVAVCGGLRLDGGNADMWFTLGLVAQRKGLKQHAFIQALRLNGNHALAWSFLGQLYLEMVDKELAKRCFDRARSADATLAYPWAGMAALHSASPQEAYASCSYALFLSSAVSLQAGLGYLAAKTNNLGLPQVYAVLEQGTKREPLQAEVHNLKGLSCESRGDLCSSIAAFKRARAVAKAAEGNAITCNLARVLCKAGYAEDAVREYERLAASAGGMKQPSELVGYAVALWRSGKKEAAEPIAKQALRSGLSSDASRSAAISLYGKIVYSIHGAAAALNVLSSVPEPLFSQKELSLTIIALGLCSASPELLSKAIRTCHKILLSEHAPDANILLALGNQVRNTSVVTRNLLKSLHSFPQSDTIRAKLGEVLTSQRHAFPALVERLVRTDAISSGDQASRQACAMASADACVAGGKAAVQELQRLLHMEPHNVAARYCLVLVLMRRASIENFPSHLRQLIIQISATALLGLTSSKNDLYIRTQLELCISECELRNGDPAAAIEHANVAREIANSPNIKLAAILQLARCFSSLQDNASAQKMLRGWDEQPVTDNEFLLRLCLLDLELRLKGGAVDRSSIDKVWQKTEPEPKWSALLEFVLARLYLRLGDTESSEAALSKAVSVWQENPVLQLLYGSTCLELAKKNTSFLSKAISSLSKAVQGKKKAVVPVACALLAQAELSRDSRASSTRKWALNLRQEFVTWPTQESRPAELYFQMALLVKQSAVLNRTTNTSTSSNTTTTTNSSSSTTTTNSSSSTTTTNTTTNTSSSSTSSQEFPENALRYKAWLQRAVHTNPACSRYWTCLASS